MIKLSTLLTLCICLSMLCTAQVKNFTPEEKQITRFDNVGNAVDAHDGEIALFNGTFYLYGTSYDCGFEWQNNTAPFCGFKSYSSKDMVTWKEESFLFDAQNPVWQSRCDGKTYGCFRPHVIYNKKNKTYVLWINVYDNVSGYRVFTSKSPIGPFTEKDQPKIAVNSDKPAASLNNGDHDLFIDDDGTGYLAITDWRRKGAIVFEQLTDDYLNGTGKVSELVTPGTTEAPGVFKRNGIYYVTYSDPNCGYCSGTGTSYRTATSIMGPWSEGKKISPNSCGGQPSFVSTMKIGADTVYLYGSDLWNNAAKNEAQANFYWAPLTFAADGSINPIDCFETFAVKRSKPSAAPDFTVGCDIGKDKQRSQLFTAHKTGKLTSFEITTLKSGYPNGPLQLNFFEAENGASKSGKAIASVSIPADSIGWSARIATVNPNINLSKGKQYLVILSSETSQGCYGFAAGQHTKNSTDLTAISEDGGQNFKVQANQKLKYGLSIK